MDLVMLIPRSRGLCLPWKFTAQMKWWRVLLLLLFKLTWELQCNVEEMGRETGVGISHLFYVSQDALCCSGTSLYSSCAAEKKGTISIGEHFWQ